MIHEPIKELINKYSTMADENRDRYYRDMYYDYSNRYGCHNISNTNNTAPAN